MKHYWTVFLLVLVLLSGCGPREPDASEAAKAHYWQVLDGAGAEVLLLSDEGAVQALDGVLCSEELWEEFSDAPEEEPLYTYVFWQQTTLTAVQDAERDYEALIWFDIYPDADTVVVRLASPLGDPELAPEDLLRFRMAVSAETAEALRNPEGFAES